MKQKYIDAIKRRIWNHVIANYTKVDEKEFVIGDIPYNYKCFLNSVQKVKEGKAYKVFACIAVDKSNWKNVIIHFINQLEDANFQDNTWGYTWEDNEYYLIREIKESEFGSVEQVLQSIRESLVESNSNAFLRWLLGVKLTII